MSDTISAPSSYAFASFKSDNDKDVNLTISVYMGNLVICVFRRGPHVRFTLNRGTLHSLRKTLSQAVKGTPGQKACLIFNRLNKETRRPEKYGMIVIGMDDNRMLYIIIGSPDFPETKFILKAPFGIEPSEPISDAENSLLGAEILIEQLSHDIPVAMLLTTQKKEQNSTGYKSDIFAKPYGQQQSKPKWG